MALSVWGVVTLPNVKLNIAVYDQVNDECTPLLPLVTSSQTRDLIDSVFRMVMRLYWMLEKQMNLRILFGVESYPMTHSVG